MLKLRHIEIGWQARDVWLTALLAHAPDVRGLVLIAERGQANLRDSRNAYIAATLHREHFATLQFSLLARGEEARAPDSWHNVSLLATRMQAMVDWAQHQPSLMAHAFGMLAHHNATAAMVRAAAQRNTPLQALASRSGRLDLAGLGPLQELAVPLLMLTGERDPGTTERNQHARQLLGGESELITIPGASEDFEEPGKLDEAASLIARWFGERLQLPADPLTAPDDQSSP